MKNQKVNDEIKDDLLGYESSEDGQNSDDDDDEESLFSSQESQEEECLSGEEQESRSEDEGIDFNESADRSQVLFDSASEDKETVSGSPEVSEAEKPPDLYHSLLYCQRLKSFEDGGWPIVKAGSSDKCTPHELAMAGLEFSAMGEAKCVICYRPVLGLTQNSDPWEAHHQKNPKCPLIKLGKPTRPDGYSLQNFFKLIGEKQALYLEYQLSLFEDEVKGMLKELVDQENGAQAAGAGA